MGLRITGTGWWEYKRKIEEGRFVCPDEKSDQPYEVLRSNRWITVLYIPVIPLGTRAMWVRCKSCKSRFAMNTIASSTPAINQTLEHTTTDN